MFDLFECRSCPILLLITCGLLIACVTVTAAAAETDTAPISIHPQNPQYVLFRGKPLVLITATEHYGSVVNRSFEFQRYLNDTADKKQTLTRTFLLFRELASGLNPHSPLKIEAEDFVAPWPRTGPGKADDGGPVWDLDRWNPEYFERLHRFLSQASELGIIVELTLFSNSYTEKVWALNPLKASNNKQGVGKVSWPDYNSLRNKDLVDRQLAYVRKIVNETHRYDNVYYEICNEPCGGFKPSASGQEYATAAEVDAWQEEIGRVIREELAKTKSKHLVFGVQTMDYDKYHQKLDAVFSGKMADVVNVHPLPNHTLAGRTYDMGGFMQRQLHLKELRDFCIATQAYRKPCVLDEDNCASFYRDDVGWTIHRKRAWTALLCGTHYDYIDFSIQAGSETGTPESQKKFRTWMRHLSEFIHSFDFVNARSQPQWIEKKPEHLVVSVLSKPGSDYVAYLADAREITAPGLGEPIRGKLAFQLPQGDYLARFYSPMTGEYLPGTTVHGGGTPVILELPTIRHDIVLRVTKMSGKLPPAPATGS